MNLNDCLGMIVQIRSNINTQWSYYLILVTLIIAWLVVGDEPVKLRLWLKLLGSVGLLGFFWLNYWRGLREMYQMLEAITEEAQSIDTASAWRTDTARRWIGNLSFRNRRVEAGLIHGVGLLATLLVLWTRSG